MELKSKINKLLPAKVLNPRLDTESMVTGSGWQDEGFPREFILQELSRRLASDMTYESGRIFGAMTQPGHEFAREIYSQYNNKNLGDPGLVPGTKKIETDTIKMLGALLGDSTVGGNIVSGGTEANLIAMMLAKKRKPEIKNPEIIVPDSAHYSFDKAAQIMGFTLHKVSLMNNYMPDMEQFRSLINESTVGLVGIAGTTALGLLDPLEEIGKLCQKHHLHYHVDGAFGGLIFPFLTDFNRTLDKFGFQIPEINSYTVDPHKFGMGVNPTGAILVKQNQKTHSGFSIPYLAGGGHDSYNLLGTRPGAAAISFWALMHHLGKEGFRTIVQRSWENTFYLRERLNSIRTVKVAVEPMSTVLGLIPTSSSPYALDRIDNFLRSKGWALGVFKKWNLLRAVVMPHITRAHIDSFIRDLKSFGG